MPDPEKDSQDFSYQGWIEKKNFEFFNDEKIFFLIRPVWLSKVIDGTYIPYKNFKIMFFREAGFSFFELNDKVSFLKEKQKFLGSYGIPRPVRSIKASFEDWPPNLAASFLTTTTKTLSNVELKYRPFNSTIDKMSLFAYRICRNLDWSNKKIQHSGIERILELIVKTAIEESARTFYITGDFDFKSDFKNMKLDAVQLGAHILATGKLPESPLRRLNKNSDKKWCMEARD